MKKLLAVDDHKDILFTLRAIGELADFNVTTCDNGIEALKLLENENFDLVIVDYYMPEMNGLELVGKIRKIKPQIPILVLTVDESQEIAEKFMAAGATDFATKPIRPPDLFSRINLHLELSQLKEETLNEELKVEIPKGMSPQTLGLVIDYLRKIKDPESSETISLGTGLAYQTVHRYLIFLEKKGFLEARLDYGKVGRPIKKYAIKGEEKFG